MAGGFIENKIHCYLFSMEFLPNMFGGHCVENRKHAHRS